MKTIEKFLNINYNIEVKKVLDKINSLKFYAKLYFFMMTYILKSVFSVQLYLHMYTRYNC